MWFIICAVVFVILISFCSYINEKRRILLLDQVARKVLGSIDFPEEKSTIYSLYLRSKPKAQSELIQDFVSDIKKSDNYCPACHLQSLVVQVGKQGRYYGCSSVHCNFTKDFQ
jgi:hypothetical protein